MWTRLKSGGPVSELSTLGTPVSVLVATDSTLYLLSRGSATEDGALLSYSLPSGPLTTLASAPGPLESLAIDSTHAYVARRADSGAVLRVGLAGGSFESVASDVSNPWQLALNSTAVYWLSSAVWTVPKAGGAPNQVVAGAGRFAVDDTTIYYTDGSYVKVRPLGGGAPWTLAFAWPHAILSRGKYLYLRFECEVQKIAKSGGAATSVAAPDPCSSGNDSLAVDDGCLYFLHANSTFGFGADGGPSWTWTGYLDRLPY